MARSAVLQTHVDLDTAAKQAPPDTKGSSSASKKSCSATAAEPRYTHYITRPLAKLVPFAFGAALVIALLIGWLNRDEGHLTPESGLGYWLGIVGGGSMLLLLIYPLRKRMKLLRRFGHVVLWFRLHMILGLIGPALVLFHSNFKLGSLNSNAALISMLIVAASGMAGRYLYSKIHLGLYGRKAQVKEILADADALKKSLGDGLPVADHVVEQLDAFTKLVMTPPKGVFASFWLLPVLRARTRFARARLLAEARRLIRSEGRSRGWSRRARRERLSGVERLVTLHFAAVKKAAAFSFYERLFAMWHIFHLPLFFILVFAAVIHVVAVHFY